jgi:DNA-binding MarR family transcriptional regulator
MADRNIEEVLDLFVEFLDIEYKSFSKTSRSMFKGILGAQYRLLSYLDTVPMESMTNLGKIMYLSKQYMTTLVDSMIKEGYVEREPDPDDRRIIYVAITQIGQKKLFECKNYIKENLFTRIEKLPQSDIEIMSVSLKNLITISKKIE